MNIRQVVVDLGKIGRRMAAAVADTVALAGTAADNFVAVGTAIVAIGEDKRCMAGDCSLESELVASFNRRQFLSDANHSVEQGCILLAGPIDALAEACRGSLCCYQSSSGVGAVPRSCPGILLCPLGSEGEEEGEKEEQGRRGARLK